MIILIIIFLSSLTIYAHTQILWLTAEMSHRLTRLSPRLMIVLIVLILLFAHLLEIIIWSGGFYGTYHWFNLGGFVGDADYTLKEFFYYSCVTYTTLGAGDITPLPDFEILTGMEALVGLMMITWSASFAYLSMQRFWPKHY